MKRLNVDYGLEMLKNYSYNIDRIAQNIKIDVRKRKLHLVDSEEIELRRLKHAYNPSGAFQVAYRNSE